MMNKKAIVTGAYGAIGKAISLEMAKHGFDVVLVGRDKIRLEKTAAELQRIVPSSIFSYERIDLSLKKEIRDLAARWKGPLHVLVNNAATAPAKRMETPEGIEMQFAVNVLGYFRMTLFFNPFMAGQPYARIVNVASYWAGGLDPDDLEFRRRSYDNDLAYRQSKQADRMLTAAFARRLKNEGITVNACHPGDVNSKLSNDLGFGGHESPARGADTPAWLAVSDEVKGLTGGYFAHRQKESCPFMKDFSMTEKLFDICAGY